MWFASRDLPKRPQTLRSHPTSYSLKAHAMLTSRLHPRAETHCAAWHPPNCDPPAWYAVLHGAARRRGLAGQGRRKESHPDRRWYESNGLVFCWLVASRRSNEENEWAAGKNFVSLLNYSNHFNNQQRAELASDGTEAANESDKTTPVAMETSHPVASQLWVDEFRPVKYTGVLSLNATYLV